MSSVKCNNCGGSVAFNNIGRGFCEYCGCEYKEDMNGAASKLVMIKNLFKQNKLISAEKLIKQCLQEFPNSGELYVMLLMCDMGVTDEQMLVNTYEDYSTNFNYIQAVSLLDEERKSVIQNYCYINQQKFY